MAKRTKKIASTDDARVQNNPPMGEYADRLHPTDPMRVRFRVLTDAEKTELGNVKIAFDALWQMVDRLGQSRDISIAKTSLEDACMRTVRHITGGKA